jgi:hypothetical protein
VLDMRGLALLLDGREQLPKQERGLVGRDPPEPEQTVNLFGTVRAQAADRGG